MPIPSSINDLSTTAGSNSPAGSESPSLIDDYLRTYASYIALLRDGAQSNAFNYAAAGGTANAITATYSPAVTTLSDSTVLLLKAAALNTGATTFSPNGLTAKPVVDISHTALQGGEIVANGDVCLQYNTSVGGGSWVLIYSSGVAVQPPAVVGSARNLKMSIAAASASATLTADEVIVKNALGSYAKVLSSFSKTINLAVTGAGGMDTGTATASSWVGIYAIFNPATQTSALLAVNAANTVLPAIYGGANMPAGYTASALLSVLRTTAASLLDIAFQTDNYIAHVDRAAVNSGTIVGSLTNIAIAGNVPGNAKTVNTKGNIASSSGNVTLSFAAAASTTGIANTSGGATSSVAGSGFSCPLPSIPLITPQNMSYSASVGSGSMSFILSTTGYTI